MISGLRTRFRNVIARDALREVVGALSPWPRLASPAEGYSIMLGVPWALRELLDVNLRFVQRCELPRLVDLHVTFDRRERPGMDAFEAETAARFPDLPLRFHRYEGLRGALVERANISTFYNGLNCVTALGRCRARAMVLHDFDLYPMRADYFEKIAGRVLDDGLRFAGVERTVYDGLTPADNVFGTWALGMDAAWLRNARKATHVFHREHRLASGALATLDPFSWLQLRTPERGDVPGLDERSMCHVKNLCSTYLRLHSGKPVKLAWRLHYLCYLRDVTSGGTAGIDAMSAEMESASGPRLGFQGQSHDFAGTRWTCSEVLRRELRRMDEILFGAVRPEVSRFLDASERFFRMADPEAGGPGEAALAAGASG